MILSVFNGDCALEAWRRAGGTGTALAWRENFLEGRLPPPETSSEDFAAFRAAEIYRIMPDLHLPEDKLRRYYLNLEAQVLALGAGDTAELFFDACMFDQLLLCRVMFLLACTEARIHLNCQDVVWGRAADLASFRAGVRRLDMAETAIFADAWRAIASGREAVADFAAGGRAEVFPFLQQGLRRYLEEFPGPDGLGRSGRQLLELIAAGKHRFPEIFAGFRQYEEFMFMGDTMCLRMLDRLVGRGLLRRGAEQGTFYLSES